MFSFENRIVWAVGLRRWCLFLILILCIAVFVGKFSWLLIMKFLKESIYWHGTFRIFNSLSRLPHEVLGCTAAIILTFFFYNVSIFVLLEELSQINCSTFYNRMRVCIVNWFESVNVTVVAHRSEGITCCM